MKSREKIIIVLLILLMAVFAFYYYKKSSSTKEYKPVFHMPVDGAAIPKYPGYLPNAPRHYRGGIHEGIELTAKENSPVMSALDGEIIEINTVESIDGDFIVILHKDNWKTKYSHLNKIYVFEGQKVKTSEVIGLSGNTGTCIRPYLDFVIYKPDGSYLGKDYDDELELQLLLSTYLR